MVKPEADAIAQPAGSHANAQEPRRLRTRAALLLAGAELLAQRPIDAIPVNDIVDAAGVAKGSFFNHFEDKAAFAAAVATEIRAEMGVRVAAANAGVLDPAERVARGVGTFVQFALTESGRARIMLRGREWLTTAFNPLNHGLQADIVQGLATGRFARRSKTFGVIYVVGLCRTVMVAVVNDQLGLAEARRLAEGVLLLGLTGLGVAEAEAETIISRTVAEIVPGAE